MPPKPTRNFRRHHPENTVYRNNLGNVYFLAGRNSDAVREYQAAIRYGPKRPLPYFNLSQVYGENLMFPEREKADLEARELDPALISALRERAGTEPVRMVFDYHGPCRDILADSFFLRT